MNNEIKEILDIMKKCYDLKDENFDNYITLYQLGLLLDYITNLQQINDNLTTSLNKKIEEGINLQQENEYLKKNNPEQNIEHFRIIKENKRKINNLREENKTLHENNQNMQEEMARVWEENERLKQDYINIRNYIKMRNVDTEVEDKALLYNIELENINKKKYLDYKSRCEKAIEYIKYNDDSLYTYEPDYDYEENLVDNYEPSNFREDLLNILQNGSEEK